MRVSFAFLVAAVAVFTSSGLVAASNPAQLQQLGPESTNNVEKADGGARFLRKRLEDESDDLTSEERGALQDLGKSAKQFLKGETRLAKLFDKTDEKLLSKGIGPDTLIKGAKRLEKSGGWSPEKIARFKAKADQYSDHFYRNFPDVRGP
ncbi:hypothetical protein DVH05_010091 [Phytophthora capsici]|nr:hypothetical protein DVH05_010091 [Phytophthora capsici]